MASIKEKPRELSGLVKREDSTSSPNVDAEIAGDELERDARRGASECTA